MRQIYPGDSIKFISDFPSDIGDYDSEELYDQGSYYVTEVFLRIAKNATIYLAGPFTIAGEELIIGELGAYEYTYHTSEFITPGIYYARWEFNNNGIDYVFLEAFEVLEKVASPNGLLDAPQTFGIMVESPLYRVLGVGETDRIFLIGHSDGLAPNDPYQVVNMQEAVNILGGNIYSPLIRALLECYNAGARDIWLVSSAPEYEFVPYNIDDPSQRFATRPEWGGKNFYEKYYDRLADTYNELKQWDLPEIIVPVEAPFFDSGDVDFLTQLVDHCLEAYELTSSPRIGIIGTRIGNFSSDTIDILANDSRLNADFGAGGKFVMIAHGEATFDLPQMGVAHVSSVAASVAAKLATSKLDSGITYKMLANVIAPYGNELTKTQQRTLAAKKVNPLIRTARGRRGAQFQAVLASDNTLAADGSDYWSIVQMRLVSKVIQQIRAMGLRSLGTIGFMQFKSDVNEYLLGLKMSDQIRDFDLLIERDKIDLYKANVEVVLAPYFGLREISFQVQVGPGA